MDCNEFSNLLDAYLAGELPDEAASRMREHAQVCAECAQLMAVRQDCRGLEEEIEVPGDFSRGWRRMIREESAMERRTQRKNAWKGWIAAAAALVFVVGGTLLTRDRLPASNQQEKLSAYAADADRGGTYYGSMARGAVANFVMQDGEMPEAASAGSAQTEKIIRNASFTLKTLNFEENLSQLQDLTAEMGGRVEYLSSSGDIESGELRTASLTLRIPAARLDEFLTGAHGIARVTSLQEEMEDVSDSYYDVQSRLDTQQKKLKRLEALMTSADQVSDLVEIENAIADAQYQIDRYTAQLKSYDSRVEDSTVRVTLREIRAEESEEASLGQRILSGLKTSLSEGAEFLKDAAVFLVAAAPWLIALALVSGIVVVVVKKSKKDRKDDEE